MLVTSIKEQESHRTQLWSPAIPITMLFLEVLGAEKLRKTPQMLDQFSIYLLTLVAYRSIQNKCGNISI